MQLLGVAVPIDRMVKVAALRWYGHVLQKKKQRHESSIEFLSN